MTPEYGYAMFQQWASVYCSAWLAALGFRMFTGLLHIWFRVPYTYCNGRVNLVAGLVATASALQMLGVSLFFDNWPVTAICAALLCMGVWLGVYGLVLERAIRAAESRRVSERVQDAARRQEVQS